MMFPYAQNRAIGRVESQPRLKGGTCTALGVVVAGLLLVVLHGLLLSISPKFAYGELPVLERPTATMVASLMICGAVYLFAVGLLLMRRDLLCGGYWWLWIIIVGLAMRALMFTSTPMLETDYYRYLWDGAVTAHGFDPYDHSPKQIMAGQAPAAIAAIADSDAKAGLTLSRVNNPPLTTIYPPTAQAFFALAHAVAPWRVEGLRIVWFALDIATLVLMIALLRSLSLPPIHAMIYWWNPLLVKEVYNSAHMEMAVLPFIAAALLLAVLVKQTGGTRRSVSSVAAAASLAIAVGAKLWPAILLPALLRQQGVNWRRISFAAAAFTVLALVLISPMLLSIDRETDEAGLTAYATTWQMNETLYRSFHWAGSWIAPANSHRVARIMVAAVLLGWILWLCRRPAANGLAVCDRALWIVAGLFLLSPTQYPWYWLWLLPMLVVRPSPGLLILTATLPLYYLRFPMREMDMSHVFNNVIVWVQFVPCFVLLMWEARRRMRSSPGGIAIA